jgi:hypothetical protein
MDIELTSSRDDGTWTWRAAGAKEPRGVVNEKLLGAGAHVGDVLRVEAEFGLDGISIIAVLPPKERSAKGPTIELVPRRSIGAGAVTSSLVERRQRRSVKERERPGSEAGRSRPERARRAEGQAATTPGARDRHRPAAFAQAEGTSPTKRPPASRSAKSRPPRLVARTVHRDALLDTLPVEQRPIAEQLAAGGLPAVRRALDEQRAAARAEGRPEAGGEAIIALAEQLLPRVKEATWLDRAEAVAERLDTVALRDLRAVVTSAAARDEAGRALLARLREALEARVEKLRATWEHEIAHALEEGRVLQALRLSARPPEPTARVPSSLVQPLADAASKALTSTTPPERWLSVLEAAAASPVRRAVKPLGIPSDDGEATKKAAAAYAGRVPALASLLGLAMPPPPRPRPAGATLRRPATPPLGAEARSAREHAERAEATPPSSGEQAGQDAPASEPSGSS